MVKHIILRTLKEEFNNDKVKSEMKAALEGLVGVVPGLIKMEIDINPLESSNVDVLLYSEFESAEALKAYSHHPAHVKVADTYVRPFSKVRTVYDYEVE